MYRSELVAVVAAVLASAGCVVGEVDVRGESGSGPAGTAAAPRIDLPTGPRATRPQGKLSTNGLRLDPDAVARLSTAPIGADWASKRELRFNAPAFGGVELTDGGLELLEYAALCALDRGSDLVVSSGGEQHRFSGLYELAPEWAIDSCDRSCQRWISACLLAHANARDVHVPISIRGPHPALSSDAAIEDRYDFQEGAFYGNLFAAEAEMYACIGHGLISDDAGTDTAITTADTYLTERLCAFTPECGFVQTGLCSFRRFDSAGTCETEAGEHGSYADCHTGSYEEPRPRTSPTFPEVLTVYLESSDSSR